MEHLRLAYRDNDRAVVIFAIQEMARRYYDLDVEILRIPGTQEYEAALPDHTADVIIEHLEYAYGDPLRGRDVTMFSAPVLTAETEMVVAPGIEDVGQLAGKRVAIRSTGRFFSTVLRLKAMGLEDRVERSIVTDAEVGRWGQWKKVASGECAATFMSPIYLKPALDAGLKVLDTPQIPVVGLFAQGCLTSFAAANDEAMRRYVQAMTHALAWLRLRREEALELGYGRPMELMGIESREEFAWRFDAIVKPLRARSYPTAAAVSNMYQIASAEFPGCAGQNPLATWDLHWLKQIDDGGFIDSFEERLTAHQPA